MRGFATGVGSKADIGAPSPTQLSFMRDTTWPGRAAGHAGDGGAPWSPVALENPRGVSPPAHAPMG